MSSLTPVLCYSENREDNTAINAVRALDHLIATEASSIDEAIRYATHAQFDLIIIASDPVSDRALDLAVAAHSTPTLLLTSQTGVSLPPNVTLVAPQGASQGKLGQTLDQVLKSTLPSIADDDIMRFFDLSPDLMCIIDEDGRIALANESFERILGYAKVEIVGTTMMDLVHREDQAATASEFARHIVAGSPSECENRMRHKDGTYRWTSWTCAGDREKRAVYASGRDITKRREMETELKLRDDAMMVSSDGIMISDCQQPDMPLVYVNKAFETITGYSESESLGRNARFLRGSTVDQPGLRIVRNALNAGQATSAVVLNTRKDGTEFWNELRLAPIRDGNGRLTHYVGVMNDITDRTIMEQALRESQERLTAILSSVRDVVYSIPLNRSTDALYFSPAVIQVTGLKPDQLYANPHAWYEAIYADDRSIVVKRDADVMEKHTAEVEYRIKHTNGTLRWLYDRAVLVKDAGGMPVRIDGIATDVTEQKNLRQTAIQAEKLAALGELIAGVAHEINNPLSIISGHAQILEMTQTGHVKEDAQTVLKMAQRASEIVRNLLTFARKQDGQKQLGAINDIVKDALELAEYRLVRHGITVSVVLQDHLPQVMMNATEIQQVLINLLTNADHAMREMPPCDRLLTVRTYMLHEEGASFVVMEVADHGAGISDDVKHKIFDPFFTTKRTGEGTGLGLSICHGIVIAHGGSIRVSTTVGHGTTMTVKLPVAAQQS